MTNSGERSLLAWLMAKCSCRGERGGRERGRGRREEKGKRKKGKVGGGRKRKYRDGGRMTSDVMREESNKKDKPWCNVLLIFQPIRRLEK